MADNQITTRDDCDEFTILFAKLYPKVKAFAKSLIKSENDAEDIAQDIFIKLWDKPELWCAYEDQYASNYIFKMVKNHIFNFLRHKRVINTYNNNIDSETLENINADIDAKELEIFIMMVVDKMPKQRKEIFTLSRMKYLSNTEIAQLLNISIRTVESHLYAALAELKKRLNFT